MIHLRRWLADYSGGLEPWPQAVIDRLGVKVVVCIGKRAGNWVRQQFNAHEPIDWFTERNKRQWESHSHRSDHGIIVVTLTHASQADWTKPASDPTNLVKRALIRTDTKHRAEYLARRRKFKPIRIKGPNDFRYRHKRSRRQGLIIPMANYHFDTSSFLKFYIEEDGSETVQSLLIDNGNHTFIISELTIIEAHSAIRRREREGTISAERAARIIEQINDDKINRFVTQDLSSAMISEATRLIDDHPLRSLDALQLAGCLVLRQEKLVDPTFVCADIRLLDSANQEGLDILNPLDPS